MKVELDDRTAATGLVSLCVGVDVDAPGRRAGPPDASGAPTRDVDLLGPERASRSMPRAALPADVPHWTPQSASRAFRIEAGVPRLGIDIDDATIPQEAFLERDAVSFTKGCFLGQELVCRIDTLGHVNCHLRRLQPRRRGGAACRGATVVVDGQERGVGDQRGMPTRTPAWWWRWRWWRREGRAARSTPGCAGTATTKPVEVRAARAPPCSCFGYPTSIAVLTRWLPVVRESGAPHGLQAHELAAARGDRGRLGA